MGAGLKWYRPSGWSWRLEVHDTMVKRDNAPRESPSAAIVAAQVDFATGGGVDNTLFQEPYSPVIYSGRRWTHNIGVTMSVSMPFGFAWKDADADGVQTRFDDCPTTAPGVVVDALGCGIDSDEDGVFDGIDRCDDTPVGAIVDRTGCPSDIDNDGVFDGIDVADDTPLGALVDSRGQHFDTDKDGIWDGLDQCNDTPLGATIDDNGCTDDPVEAALLAGEILPVPNVRFEAGSGEIDPLSFHYINSRARIIERWTGNRERPLRIEIGVHTDGLGTVEYNRQLSQRRAEAVRLYLLENYFGMGANNLVARGYGESQPVAGDDTADGRAANNRVEFRMIGEGAPPEEWDFGLGDLPDDAAGGSASGGTADGDVAPLPPDVDPEDIEVPEEPEMPSLPDFPEDDGP
jgi:outer membrane protein OmpA-like peptidoglycan-associated protein